MRRESDLSLMGGSDLAGIESGVALIADGLEDVVESEFWFCIKMALN
jgi:hypothetical protein